MMRNHDTKHAESWLQALGWGKDMETDFSLVNAIGLLLLN